MSQQPNGETRLFLIIGDPVKYAESSARLTVALSDRGHHGLCIPMQVPEGDLNVVMSALSTNANVDGILVTRCHPISGKGGTGWDGIWLEDHRRCGYVGSG